jgi:hypothetical protein
VGFVDLWKGLTMDSLNFHPGPPCPNLLHPAGEPPLKRPYGSFRNDPPAWRSACGRHPPLWTPHAVRLCTSTSTSPGPGAQCPGPCQRCLFHHLSWLRSNVIPSLSPSKTGVLSTNSCHAFVFASAELDAQGRPKACQRQPTVGSEFKGMVEITLL